MYFIPQCTLECMPQTFHVKANSEYVFIIGWILQLNCFNIELEDPHINLDNMICRLWYYSSFFPYEPCNIQETTIYSVLICNIYNCTLLTHLMYVLIKLMDDFIICYYTTSLNHRSAVAYDTRFHLMDSTQLSAKYPMCGINYRPGADTPI